MPYLYLILAVFMNASSSIFGKQFHRSSRGTRDHTPLYNVLLLSAVFLGWSVLYATSPAFDLAVLPYSLLFALCYTAGSIGLVCALKHGPAALTTLLVSLSLILTACWGFLFWDDTPTVTTAIGLATVVISLCLCLKNNPQEKTSFSKKWLIFVLLAGLGNAGCTIVQRTQQIRHHGSFGPAMMWIATGISAAIGLFLFLRSDKTETKAALKTGGLFPVLAGLFNVVLNLCVMRLALTDLSPALIYPTLGAGGLAVVTLFSLVLFRERPDGKQWLGIGIGAVAIILLSV